MTSPHQHSRRRPTGHRSGASGPFGGWLVGRLVGWLVGWGTTALVLSVAGCTSSTSSGWAQNAPTIPAGGTIEVMIPDGDAQVDSSGTVAEIRRAGPAS